MGRIAFWFALVGLAVLAGAAIGAGAVSPGYDHLTHYISALGASDVATGRWVSAAFVVSGLLLAAFWIMAAAALPGRVTKAVGCGLLALNGLGLLAGGVFPCQTRCLNPAASPSQMLHTTLGGLGYVLGIVGIFVLSAAAMRWTRGKGLFWLGLICGGVAATALPLVGPEFPWLGAAQRVLEAAMAVWTLAIALRLRSTGDAR